MDLSNITVNTHSSIRITGSKVLYFDPFEIAKECHDADIIFITHEHYDHFDPASIHKLMKEDTVLVAPASMSKALAKEFPDVSAELWEPGTIHEFQGLWVETIPAYNILKPFHPKGNRWQGYLVKMDGISYYVAGDTDVNEEMKSVRCDVALVPIGGKYTMDKKQAAEYILSIKPAAVIPTHYGTIVGKPTDGDTFMQYINDANPTIISCHGDVSR